MHRFLWISLYSINNSEMHITNNNFTQHIVHQQVTQSLYNKFKAFHNLLDNGLLTDPADIHLPTNFNNYFYSVDWWYFMLASRGFLNDHKALNNVRTRILAFSGTLIFSPKYAKYFAKPVTIAMDNVARYCNSVIATVRVALQQ